MGQDPKFVLPNAIGWWGGGRDTIWVRDQNPRITLYTPDGEYVSSFRWVNGEYQDRWTFYRPDVLLPDGTMLGVADSPVDEELATCRSSAPIGPSRSRSR